MDESKKIVKEYTNEDITIVWQPHMCTHSKKCWKELLPVFDPRRKPWIDMDAASSERIITQVGVCPSKALSIK